jgi:hydrogenase maturation protease
MSIGVEPGQIAVVGVGNAFAQDDAAGILVARSLRGRLPDGVRLIEHEGEPTALLDAWDGLEAAIVVDAVAGASEPGTVHRLELTSGPLPATIATHSTHAFNLAAAIELGRVLDRMPRWLLVIGVEGRRFEAGTELGADVEQALAPAAALVLDEVRMLCGSEDEET